MAVQIFESTPPSGLPTATQGYVGAVATSVIVDTTPGCSDTVCWLTASFPNLWVNPSSTYYLVVSIPHFLADGSTSNPIYEYSGLADATLPAASSCTSVVQSSAGGAPFLPEFTGIAFAIYGANAEGTE